MEGGGKGERGRGNGGGRKLEGEGRGRLDRGKRGGGEDTDSCWGESEAFKGRRDERD